MNRGITSESADCTAHGLRPDGNCKPFVSGSMPRSAANLGHFVGDDGENHCKPFVSGIDVMIGSQCSSDFTSLVDNVDIANQDNLRGDHDLDTFLRTSINLRQQANQPCCTTSLAT